MSSKPTSGPVISRLGDTPALWQRRRERLLHDCGSPFVIAGFDAELSPGRGSRDRLNRKANSARHHRTFVTLR